MTIGAFPWRHSTLFDLTRFWFLSLTSVSLELASSLLAVLAIFSTFFFLPSVIKNNKYSVTLNTTHQMYFPLKPIVCVFFFKVKPKRLQTLVSFPGCWPTHFSAGSFRLVQLWQSVALFCFCFVFSAACLAESLWRSWFRNMAGCMIQKALDRRQAAWWNTRSLCNRRALASVIMIHAVHGSDWPFLCCITGWSPVLCISAGKLTAKCTCRLLNCFVLRLLVELLLQANGAASHCAQSWASHLKKEKSLGLLKCDLKQNNRWQKKTSRWERSSRISTSNSGSVFLKFLYAYTSSALREMLRNPCMLDLILSLPLEVRIAVFALISADYATWILGGACLESTDAELYCRFIWNRKAFHLKNTWLARHLPKSH